MKRTVEDVFHTVPDIDDLPNGLDGDAKRRIQEYAEELTEENKEDIHEDRNQNIVTKELCELIHDMDSKGMRHKDIIECMPFSTQHTLYYHLREDCKHSHRTTVTYDECGWMRVYAKQGAPLRTLAVLFNISRENASTHLSGDCSHEDMLEPVSTEQLRANSVETASVVTSICPVCDEEFTHKEYRDRKTCSVPCRNIYAANKSKQTQ